jgi:hypothetical protein
MATVDGLFENIKGVLGNVVVAHRGKMTYLRCRPSKSKNPLTEKAIAKQERFGFAGKIGKAVSSLNEIKYFWEPFRTGNKTCYNCIFQANHQKSEIEELKWEIILSPVEGFEILNPLVTLGESGFIIENELTESRCMQKIDEAKYIISEGVIILRNPIVEIYPEYLLLTFKTKMIPIGNGGKFTAEVIYEGADRIKFLSYTSKNIFGVFITMDENKEPMEISKRFTVTI